MMLPPHITLPYGYSPYKLHSVNPPGRHGADARFRTNLDFEASIGGCSKGNTWS